MDRFDNIVREILDYLKTYGAEGVFWLAVIAYIISLILPQYQIDILSSNNVLLLGMLSLGTKMSTNKFSEYKEHKIGNQTRLATNLEVRNELLNLKSDLNAQRVYILEMHNGNRNNANLPFLYIDMTFEETNDTHPEINKEFQNINISLYPFAEYLFKNKTYIGHVSGLKEIDRKFYNRVAEQGTQYCAMSVLRYQGHLVGMVGASLPYPIDEKNKYDIQESLLSHADVISDYLTFKK